MIYFGTKLDQFLVLVSLEVNVIETNRFFLQKEGVNQIELGIKKDPMGLKMSKMGVNRVEVPTIFKYWRLIITIYVINGTRRIYIYMYLCIFPDIINRKYSVLFRLCHVQGMEKTF